MKTLRLFSLLVLSSILLLTACGLKAPTATPTPAVSPTPDPCSPDRIKMNASRVHELTRAFDDTYQLASSLPRSQVAPQISKLQDIRRVAQDQAVPTCLVQLKKLQLDEMNTAIQAFLAFVGGADQKLVNEGVTAYRQQHDAYTIELARLLDVTVTAPPVTTAGAQAPAAESTPAPAAVTAPASPMPSLAVSNPGSSPVNLHVSASMTSEVVGTLQPRTSAAAFGKSQNGEWILIEDPSQPGKSAWVYASLVQLSGDPAALAVIAPTP